MNVAVYINNKLERVSTPK